jgi:hypothetical protein
VSRAISRKLAQRARDVVIEYFAVYCHDEDGNLLPAECLPRLYEPGHSGSGWCLGWEGNGPDDWTILVTAGGDRPDGTPFEPATFPRGVFAEPINGCELGLYPA